MLHPYYLQYRFTQSFFNLRYGFDCKIVCTTHPLAYFRLFLVKHGGKVFLSQATLFKNSMDTVNNEKG